MRVKHSSSPMLLHDTVVWLTKKKETYRHPKGKCLQLHSCLMHEYIWALTLSDKFFTSCL